MRALLVGFESGHVGFQRVELRLLVGRQVALFALGVREQRAHFGDFASLLLADFVQSHRVTLVEDDLLFIPRRCGLE
ncbi:hypothetical protein QZM43_12155 [Burkholderia orbicola]|uniref:hypothetical protein n=1 Tax=Burkholderia orbicola TaxID=2978683 RepID=UPI0026521181|nr:hypothetical protein [Burkholderia orbicola]MDN7503481.1 hypothetical protein [Burkholderia orbicola]